MCCVLVCEDISGIKPFELLGALQYRREDYRSQEDQSKHSQRYPTIGRKSEHLDGVVSTEGSD